MYRIEATIGEDGVPEVITGLCTSNEQVSRIMKKARDKNLPLFDDLTFARLTMYDDDGNWLLYSTISHDDYKKIIEMIFTERAIENSVSLPGISKSELPNVTSTLSIQQAEKAKEIEAYGKTLNPAVQYIKNLKSENSKKVYTRVLNIVSQRYADCDHDVFDWSTLRYFHIESLVAELREKNLSGSRINSFLTALKGTARQARKLKQLPLDDYESIIDVKAEKADRKPKEDYMKKEERDAIYEHLELEGKASSIRNLAIIALMLGCGLRRDEVCNLKLLTKDGLAAYKKDFSIKGKGGVPALINMPGWVYEWVNEWLETRIDSGTQTGEFVFTRVESNDDLRIKNKDGTFNQLTGHGIAEILKNVCINAGVKIYKPHDLRATFCTNLLASGVPIHDASHLMRHKSVMTTELYDRTNILKRIEMWEKANTK